MAATKNEALELGMIDDPAYVNGLAGVADARADDHCDVNWNKRSVTLNAIVDQFTEVSVTFNNKVICNGKARFRKCKQFFEYQRLILLRDIWWSKF